MSDEKCLVNTCCCGCTLRTGSLIIGILSLIGGLLGLIGSIYAAVQAHYAVLWFSVVIYAIMTLAAIFLLHGIRTDNSKFVRVWVYVEIVNIVLFVIAIIVTAIAAFSLGNLIGNLIAVALMVYFVVVVRSYAIQLETGGASNPA